MSVLYIITSFHGLYKMCKCKYNQKTLTMNSAVVYKYILSQTITLKMITVLARVWNSAQKHVNKRQNMH